MTVVENIAILHTKVNARESPEERKLHDAKMTEIYEGISEIQRLILGSMLVKYADYACAGLATKSERGFSGTGYR